MVPQSLAQEAVVQAVPRAPAVAAVVDTQVRAAAVAARRVALQCAARALLLAVGRLAGVLQARGLNRPVSTTTLFL